MKYKRINTEQIMGNNRIPPRLRFRCDADSPQRGEYRTLCRPSGQENEIQ